MREERKRKATQKVKEGQKIREEKEEKGRGKEEGERKERPKEKEEQRGKEKQTGKERKNRKKGSAAKSGQKGEKKEKAKTSRGLDNMHYRDSSGKMIFEDPILCSQFLKSYVDIPMLKEVKPEDIEDVTERYVHMFLEERNSDVVKKVHLKENSFYLISLIEHKSDVDYNVVIKRCVSSF